LRDDGADLGWFACDLYKLGWFPHGKMNKHLIKIDTFQNVALNRLYVMGLNFVKHLDVCAMACPIIVEQN